MHKLAQSERNSTLIGNSSLCTHVPNIKSIFQIIVKKKWRQLNIWPNFKPEYPERTKLQSPTAASCPKIIGPELNVNLICNASLYTHIPKIKSISPSIAKKEMTAKYLAKFQNPRAITRPKIIGPKQNVQLICNSSLYIHIP